MKTLPPEEKAKFNKRFVPSVELKQVMELQPVVHLRDTVVLSDSSPDKEGDGKEVRKSKKRNRVHVIEDDESDEEKDDSADDDGAEDGESSEDSSQNDQ